MSQPIPGVSDRFSRDTPNIPVEDRPVSPTDLLDGSGDEIETLDAPDTTPGQGLSAPEDSLGQQHQIPGDQFEPSQIPGDQFEPTQVPDIGDGTDEVGVLPTLFGDPDLPPYIGDGANEST